MDCCGVDCYKYISYNNDDKVEIMHDIDFFSVYLKCKCCLYPYDSVKCNVLTANECYKEVILEYGYFNYFVIKNMEYLQFDVQGYLTQLYITYLHEILHDDLHIKSKC